MLILLLCVTTFFTSYAGAASSHDDEQQAAASSSLQITIVDHNPMQEYNLQRLILPFAGDRYLGADPYFRGSVRDPERIFLRLQSSAFEYTLYQSHIEHIGRFKHSKEFKQRSHSDLSLTFRAGFPQLVRNMTLLADHGLLAFDEGFYTIASAALRASILLERDKAINERRIENIPSLPASFHDHCNHIEGLDALPDAAMIAHFYTQLKNLPRHERNIFTTHRDKTPTDKKLFKSIDNLQALLRPFMDQVYTQVGPYAEHLKIGIADWHQAQQEFADDIQTIQQAENSRWHKLAAMRALFYATERKSYHTQAPIAVTHRPTQLIFWGARYEQGDITIQPYYPMNGALPAYFANQLFAALDSIVQGQQEMDPEHGQSSMRPKLTFDEIPSEEVMRLLNHEVFGRPVSATESAVANIEAKLLGYLHDCLTTKIYTTLQSSADSPYIDDICDILANAIQNYSGVEQRPLVCVTQPLLDALPLSFLNDLSKLLAKTSEDEISDDETSEDDEEDDEETDALQTYYMKRALQEGKLQNFDMYLHLYNHPAEKYQTTTRWVQELPSLWHFRALTRDRQKEFLLRMWKQQIKVALDAESFMQVHDCGPYCSKRCWTYASFFYYLAGGKEIWPHNCYPDAMRMLQDTTQQADWLPEMKDELVVLRRQILQNMYPRYKAIIQSRAVKNNDDLRKQEQERVMQYIQNLDADGCSQLIDCLQQISQPNLTEAHREALLPIEVRTYPLFPPEKQQELVQALHARYSVVDRIGAWWLRARGFLFGL
jgi:hypothetical protein